MLESEFRKPETIAQEIILHPSKVIMSKTNKDGILEFVNDYFVEISGYEEYELMGKSIYCTQHPDMPEVIFKMMWEKLLNKENFHVIIKSLAKNGKYYWAVSDFAYKLDEETDEIISIYNRRKKPSREAILFFDKLYTKLKDIERESGIILSEKYLKGHLEEKGKTFTELLNEFTGVINKNASIISIAPEKKSLVTEDKTNIITNTDNTKTLEKSIKERIKEIKENAEIKTAIIKENKPKVKETIKELPKIKVSKSVKETNTNKKSLFQKLFGKTDEEIAEEKRLKGLE